ncbi:LysM peptidoglycan-binding domain-containing protein [Emticicia oligotrophica]|uniref:LysM peptidoglycan-binding domain-containing protein n=1 Tax=Emticicia oligotrophica TaxID=312279 RepID=UPI00273B3A50|nr:LysM peptidoglycan-binding domain-containing protein [Emticicia oligotrophica]
MFRLFCCIIALGFILTNAYANPVDSLGVEKRNGKILVQHKVEKGETLYSILRRYDCTEKDFLAANTSFKKGTTIAPEQVIEIPFKSKKIAKKAPVVEIIPAPATSKNDKKNIDENGIEIVDIPEATPKETAPVSEKVSQTDSAKGVLEKTNAVKKTTPAKAPLKGKTHTVLAGQNLFTVAKLYNIKVWQIREWNGLTNDALRVNQVLTVEKPANFVAKVVKKDTLKPKTVQVQAPAGDVAVKEKEQLKDQAVVNKPVTSKPAATTVPNAPGGKKFSEQGIAEMIDAGASTNKFLALHRTAPVGTLIKVANQANGQSVWVKVIGKLSSAGDVVIKISPKAFEKLSPKDKRIRADLSYSVSN